MADDAKSPQQSRHGRPGPEQQGMRDLYGQAVNAAEDGIDAVRQMPRCLDDTVSRYIDTKPYGTVLIALGLGWIIGRSHRPF